MGPNTAAALAFAGLLGIYLECVRPGRIVAGCLGIALLLWGSYELWLYKPADTGCLLLSGAVLLFLIELAVNTRFIAGVAGTAALFAGLESLIPTPHRINAVLALSLSLVLGTITTLVCISARESRRKKRADLR